MKKLISFILLLVMFSIPALAQEKKLQVVASFSVLGDMVQQVGGEDVAVKTLVGPDGDAHTYQPTPDDAKALAHADVIFVNGLGLEGWVERLIAASGTKAHVVVASKGVTPRTMIEEEGGKAEKVTDPHAWQDLKNAHSYIKNILAGLVAADANHLGGYKARAEAFDNAVTDMDKWVRQQLKDIPPAQRKVITSHDAFGYFGASYDITFMAPSGLSTESEPSAAQLAKLIDQIKKEKVKRVFIENMTDPRLIQQMAKDSGADMGGTLYSDALSPSDGPAPHYLDMFRNNVPKLVEAMKLNGV